MFYFRQSKVLSLSDRKISIMYYLTTREQIALFPGVPLKKGQSENLQDAIEFLKCEKNLNLTVLNLPKEYLLPALSQLKDNLTSFNCWEDLDDLSFLEQFPNLTSVQFNNPNSAKSLWDTSKNPKLKEVILYNATSMTDISGLTNSTIEKLILSGVHLAYEDKTDFPKISDIRPISTLKNLEHLEYFTAPNPRLEKKDLVLLSKLTKLKFLRLSINYFTFSQFAWLKSKLPLEENITAFFYTTYQRWKDIFCHAVIGSDTTDWVEDLSESEVLQYVKTFNDLVEIYKDVILPPNN